MMGGGFNDGGFDTDSTVSSYDSREDWCDHRVMTNSSLMKPFYPPWQMSMAHKSAKRQLR